MDQSIFGLRFQSNEALQPTLEEVRQFLDSAKRPGKPEKHKDDLAKYVLHLKQLEDFAAGHKQGSDQQDFHEKKLFGVLAHSNFFKPSLKTAVEQYKYHYHSLATIDFKKPLTFIKSAEEEIGRLNPKKKDQQAKVVRLQDMVFQRRRDLDDLNKRWIQLNKELTNIAVYIKDNLRKIQGVSESSISLLVGLHIDGEKKNQLIEDIKTHFKEQIRDNLQTGPVTKEYIETMKEDVAGLQKQVSQLVLEDVYSMTGVYEGIHDHAEKIVGTLETLIQQAKEANHKNHDEDQDVFGRIEDALVSLLSDYQFVTGPPEEALIENEHDKLLFEKRKEMLVHLFTLLKRG